MERQLRLPLPADSELGFDPDRMRERFHGLTVRQVGKALRWWCHGATPTEQRALALIVWPLAAGAARGRDRQRLWRRIGDIFAFRGLVFGESADFVRAADAYHEALRRPRRKRWAFTMHCLESRAVALLRLGCTTEAAAEIARLRTLAAQHLSVQQRAYMESELGDTLAADHGLFEPAVVSYTRAADCYRVVDDLVWAAECEVAKGEVLLRLGRLGDALEVVRGARRMLVRAGDERELLRADEILVEIFSTAGDYRRQLGAASRAYGPLVAQDSHIGASLVQMARARALDKLDRIDERDEAFRLAIGHADRVDPEGESTTRAVRFRLEYARALVEGRRFASAVAAATPAVARLESLEALRGSWFAMAFDTIGRAREALVLGRAAGAVVRDGARWSFDDPRTAMLLPFGLPVGDAPASRDAIFLSRRSPRLLLHLSLPLARN